MKESSSSQSRALEGLPNKFVVAMRTLFDVMDDAKTGLVSLSDIEARWTKEDQDGGEKLPNGVIESLRKVATADNLLTFERFCAGLKICLLRNQGVSSNPQTEESTDEDQSQGRVPRKSQPLTAPSPTFSLPPRLEPGSGTILKSTRVGVAGAWGQDRAGAWGQDRKLGDGVAAASDGELERRQEHQEQGSQTGQPRKQPTKRRESHSRRHTLQNGIDYGLLRRMKAIEEERDVLMRGFQCVQRAEEWYKSQLGQVQERMRNLGKHGGAAQEHVGSTEAAREKMLFQSARIHEVNQHLNCLMSSDVSFPMSINLAVGGASHVAGTGGGGSSIVGGGSERQIARLKEQNRLLTEEVGNKSTAITVLDQEKGALIRELFQARARARQQEMTEAEATFM